jgi:hypothetical protein
MLKRRRSGCKKKSRETRELLCLKESPFLQEIGSLCELARDQARCAKRCAGDGVVRREGDGAEKSGFVAPHMLTVMPCAAASAMSAA